MLEKLLRFFYRPPALYIRRDNKKGRPVVFLHGIASDGSCWNKTIINLKHNNLRLIVIDLLGFGKSPKPARSTYSLSDHAKAIEKTIKKLNINQPVVIVGHSMGSLIAIELAKRGKIDISRLLLCSPPIYLPADLKTIELEYSKTARSKTNAYFALYKLIADKPSITLKAAKIVAAGFSGFTLTSQNWNPFKKSLINSIKSQTTLTDIQALSQPVEIIYGLFDLLIIPKNYKYLQKKMPGLKITKTRAGHIMSPNYSKLIASRLLSGLAKKP